jgi:formylglycine-generating enzyme required for sulfatase activity
MAAVPLVASLVAPAQAVNIDWITVGDGGNTADDTGYGAVGNGYRISAYEITNEQYREFLNAKAAVGDPHGLYNEAGMGGSDGGIARTGSGTAGDPWVYVANGGDANWDSRPVNYVSFWDAARFANWLHNGQGTGDTESGAYVNVGNQTTFARQAGAQVFIPTEDEWYKAAYYKGGGLNAGYWDYPTQSDTPPTSEVPPGTDLVNGSANYHHSGYPFGPPYYTAPVGAYTAMPSTSAYGTFDQGGNVWEWHETAISADERGIRGCSWHAGAHYMIASFRRGFPASDENVAIGFRVASTIPEPSTLSLLALGGLALLRRRRKR